MRVAAVRSCPTLIMPAATAPFAAAARSASANTTNGPLPPSSRWTRFSPSAARRMISAPVPVSPVRDTMSTCGWPTRAGPTTSPRPVMTFTTPAGTPASEHSCARRIAVKGVSEAGFSTTVLPAAIAGNTFHTAIWSG